MTPAGREFAKADRLLRPAEFARVYELRQSAAAGPLVLYAAPRLAAVSTSRLGLSVSRRVGNAVVRNRVKRKLRPLLRQCAKESLLPDGRLVVIARQDAHTHPSEILNRDLRYCLRQLKKNLAKQAAAKAAILPETS